MQRFTQHYFRAKVNQAITQAPFQSQSISFKPIRQLYTYDFRQFSSSTCVNTHHIKKINKRQFSTQNSQGPLPTASISEPLPLHAQPSAIKSSTTPSSNPTTEPILEPTKASASIPSFFQRHPWVIGQLVTTLPLISIVGYQQLVINEVVAHTKGVEDAVEQFSDILEYHHNVIGEMVEFPDEYYSNEDQPGAGGPGSAINPTFTPQSRFPQQSSPQSSQFRTPSPPPSMQIPAPPQPNTPNQPRQQYQSRSPLFNTDQPGNPSPTLSRDQQRVPANYPHQ